MISILVITPIVLYPALSHYLASLSPSEIARSWLAGITQRMIVLGSLQYLNIIFYVLFCHLGCDFFDIFLPFYVDTSDTRKIDDCEIRAIG